MIAILVLTIYDDDDYILGLLQAGAAGYLLKNAYGDTLVHAIRTVKTGEFALDPVVGQRLLKRAAKLPPAPVKIDATEQLTTREIEVLELTARGMNNRDIALKLGIGVRTVKGHLVNIFAKLKVSSRTEAVLYALKMGWVRVEN
jgi:two-component system, NarL family, response regulator LiaR